MSTKSSTNDEGSFSSHYFWDDYASSLDGTSAYGEFGLYVSNSYDGKIMAASGNNIARIFEFNGGRENEWSMSNDLSNTVGTTRGFFRVALSNDGTTVALGAPNNDRMGANSGEVTVYGRQETLEKKNGTDGWSQTGQRLNGEDEEDLFGNDLSLSKDGRILVVGIHGGGYVNVYGYREQSDRWAHDTSIVGDKSDGFGYSVSVSGNGKATIVGAPYHREYKGLVRMYDMGDLSLVQEHDGIAADDHFGYSVAMSLDGSRAAAGAWGGRYARVYELRETEWLQFGTNIFDGNIASKSTNSFSAFGKSVSLSEDGGLIAVGAPEDNEHGSRSGLVQIYELQRDSDQWIQLGTNINGDRTNEKCGAHVSLASRGDRLAFGCPGKHPNELGQIQIFEIPGYHKVESTRPSISSSETSSRSIPTRSPTGLRTRSPARSSDVVSTLLTRLPTGSSPPTGSISNTASTTEPSLHAGSSPSRSPETSALPAAGDATGATPNDVADVLHQERSTSGFFKTGFKYFAIGLSVCVLVIPFTPCCEASPHRETVFEILRALARHPARAERKMRYMKTRERMNM